MKRKLLTVLLALSLLCGLAAPAALAAGGPGLSYELAAGDTALTLTLSGLDPDAPVYAVQVEFPLSSVSGELTFYPDSDLVMGAGGEDALFSELKTRLDGEERIAVLYLDSPVPINLSSSVELGTFASDKALTVGSAARLIIVKGQLEGTSYENISLRGGEQPDEPAPSPSPAPSQPPSGGSSGGGSSSGRDEREESSGTQTVKATPDKDGVATVTQKALASAKRLEVKGDAVLVLEGQAIKALRSAGGDVRIQSAATPSSRQSRSVRAQLGGADCFALSVTAKGGPVSLDGGSIQVSVPYSGKGRPLVYLVGDGGLTRLGYASEENGRAVFELKDFEARVAVLDVVHGFTDVNGWYDGYVNTVVVAGVMNGVSAQSFQPEKTTTRAELVTMLARLSGDALPEAGTDFSDVPGDAWFAPYVAWAKQTGVTSGVSVDSFQPQGSVTREQVATMLVRFAAVQGLDLGQEQSPTAFTDSVAISGFAAEAVSLMQRAGILSGKSDGRFDPQGTATRAECAKMLAIILQAMD